MLKTIAAPRAGSGSKKTASGRPAHRAPARPNGAAGEPVTTTSKAATRTATKPVKSPERRVTERVQHAGRVSVAAAAAGASRGKYVYCIIESGDPLRFGPIGIGADPSDVYTVHYKNLAAVVSDAPLEVLDSTRENVLAHERVNETVMHEHTVIPMSFGTIFKTREDIVELLRSAAGAFGDVLNKMQNKLEFGLKVLWDRDQAIREVEGEDDDISRLKKEIS
ncbi:MAG TPA: GvpL/GvpF family gas vesicle protein, partial [Vicinamibacterales bacterium]|nr:GvpL/GvpF family gas vesicle protein [Vicinamibacterales bacterium]